MARPPRPTARKLLAWYDAHARDLPWRVKGGSDVDPYRVWLSEIMLQQTTVAAVIPYFERFLTLWPDVHSLAAADRDEVLAAWAGLGYYSRARNLHACADSICEEWGGAFPSKEKDLLTLPGIGAYTAAAIAAIAFDEPAAVVDGNVERVMTRQFALTTPLPKVKAEVKDMVTGLVPRTRPGDFAQAMMDLGATVCSPRSPDCGNCPWSRSCAARKEGDQEDYPVRPPKKEKPIRRGIAWRVEREDGAMLLEQRPEKGLLAAMWQPPTNEWEALTPRSAFARRKVEEGAPIAGDWTRVPGLVTHTFTHFNLELAVFQTRVGIGHNPERGRFVTMDKLESHALPTVMKKVLDHGRS